MSAGSEEVLERGFHALTRLTDADKLAELEERIDSLEKELGELKQRLVWILEACP